MAQNQGSSKLLETKRSGEQRWSKWWWCRCNPKPQFNKLRYIGETTETVESITLDEAKKINDGNTDGNYQDISISLTRFKRTVLESLSTPLLTFESHLQHLLALSNVLLIGKKSHHTDLERHFTSKINCIRKSIYNSLKFKGTDHKFPHEYYDGAHINC